MSEYGTQRSTGPHHHGEALSAAPVPPQCASRHPWAQCPTTSGTRRIRAKSAPYTAAREQWRARLANDAAATRVSRGDGPPPALQHHSSVSNTCRVATYGSAEQVAKHAVERRGWIR